MPHYLWLTFIRAVSNAVSLLRSVKEKPTACVEKRLFKAPYTAKAQTTAIFARFCHKENRENF